MAEQTEHFVEASDGARLHVVEQGAEPDGSTPVVLLPGMGQSTTLVELQSAACAGTTRAIAVDQRGVGASDKTPGDYSIEQLVDDVVRIIETIAARPVVLAGCSFGGIVATELARTRPDLVAQLVTVAAAAPGPGVSSPPEVQAARAEAALLPDAEATRLFLPFAFAPGWVETNPQRYEHFLRQHLDQPAGTTGQAAAREQYRHRSRPEQPITTPAHIVHGAEDRVVPYANAGQLAACFDRAEVVRMNSCGHLCWLERPHVVNRLLVALATGDDTSELAV